MYDFSDIFGNLKQSQANTKLKDRMKTTILRAKQNKDKLEFIKILAADYIKIAGEF